MEVYIQTKDGCCKGKIDATTVSFMVNGQMVHAVERNGQLEFINIDGNLSVQPHAANRISLNPKMVDPATFDGKSLTEVIST